MSPLLHWGWELNQLLMKMEGLCKYFFRDSGLLGRGQKVIKAVDTVDLEVKHGVRIADLAKQNGVQHLVYSSVGGAERETGSRDL